jgi:hypothetical protein
MYHSQMLGAFPHLLSSFLVISSHSKEEKHMSSLSQQSQESPLIVERNAAGTRLIQRTASDVITSYSGKGDSAFSLLSLKEQQKAGDM